MLTVATTPLRTIQPSPIAVTPSTDHVPQLLMVYSSRFNAQAIREHVQRLRTKGFVWWGRFSSEGIRLDEAAARARWPHVAALADARAAEKKPLLLYVTNYVDLHVLKVSEVVFGQDPAGRTRFESLPYYAGRSVPLWFRVEDARAIAYDQSMTNDYFTQRLGAVRHGARRRNGEPYERAYDPTAAIHYEYPIVVDAPTTADLFDRERPPGGTKRWADAPDAMSSRPVQKARAQVERLLTPALWARLTPDSQDLLANGWVEKGRMENDDDVDPAMGFTRIANAVERELCVELMVALTDLAQRLRASGHPFGDALSEELRASMPRDTRGHASHWSMGSCLELLRRLVGSHRRALLALELRALYALCTQLKALEDLKKLRDPAAHGRGAAIGPALRRAVVEFYSEGGPPLALIVSARDEVEKACASPAS